MVKTLIETQLCWCKSLGSAELRPGQGTPSSSFTGGVCAGLAVHGQGVGSCSAGVADRINMNMNIRGKRRDFYVTVIARAQPAGLVCWPPQNASQ